MKVSSFISIPKKLSKLLTKKQKIIFFVLLALTIFLSLIETVGISAIMPFITVASNPAILDEGNYKTAYDFLGFTDKNSFIIVFGLAIVAFYLFRSVFNVGYTYIINKYSFSTYRNFTLNAFKTFLSIKYKDFVQKNSGEIIQIIKAETANISRILLASLQLFSELFTFLMLYIILFFVNWKMSLALTFILTLVSFIVLIFLVRISKKQGKRASEANLKQARVLHEALYNYKFVKLRCHENNFLDNYKTAVNKSIRAEIINTTLGLLPRSFLENFGFSLLICIVIFITWRTGTPELIIPTISMYALALYRMLPAITRLLGYINEISYRIYALELSYNAINQEIEIENDEKINFINTISLNSIFFRYNTGNNILKNTTLKIKKGESIAITGESGSGKSTLVDLLIGIHKPDSGKLEIDGVPVTNNNIRAWRKKIGYIPQNIYLFDGTVAENVTFSAEYNEERLIKALKMANIWDFLEKGSGINTMVGEGGIQISGGQKQRIGIARALYTDPEVLVLDEATSALDNETESKIMDEIYEISKDRTLIVIAHRLSTVERCKRRITVENGSIKE